MRILLQTLLLSLACAGIYCATTVNQNSVNHSISARTAKTMMLADGTEPFPRKPK